PNARRVALHGDVGHVLEQQAGAPAAELAHHFLEASEGGTHVERAVEYGRQAATEATARLAYEAAAQVTEPALQALALRDAPPAGAVRGARRVAPGEARQRMGALARAGATLQDAIAIARRLEPARRGPLLARAALALAGGGPEVGRVDSALVELLDQALEAL